MDPQTLNVLDEAGRLASVGTVETAFKSKAIAHRFASGVKRSEAELEDFARALESLKNAPSIPLDEEGRSLIKKCEETMKDIQGNASMQMSTTGRYLPFLIRRWNFNT